MAKAKAAKAKRRAAARPRKPAIKVRHKHASGNTALARTIGAATLPVGEIKVGKRFRKDFGDLDALARSIDDRGGLIHAVAITPGHNLIAGERRIRAWKLSRFAADPIPVRIIDIDSILAGEWDENAPGIRKDFTFSEAVAIAEALLPLERARAAARQRAGKNAPRAGAPPEERGGRAADKVAGLVGMDRKTLDKAREVVEAARDNPEKFGPLLEQMDRTGRAHGPHKRLTNIRQSEQIKREPPGLPGLGPYRAGSIDMPWASEPDGKSPSETGRGYYGYPTMTTPEMIAFGDNVVPLLHPEGGHFWFWTTNFHLIEGHAFKVLDAWSSKAEAAGVGPIRRIGKRTWVKDVMGRGQVFRGQTEDVILCAFGKSPPALGAVLSTRLDGNVREDSEKPVEFYRDVEIATPAPRYFELFSRRTMPENWDGHGDQVGKLGAPIAIESTVEPSANDPASDAELLIEWKALGALDCRDDGISVAGPILGSLRDRKLISQGDDGLTKLGRKRLRELDAKFNPPARPAALPVETFADELATTLHAIERGEPVADRLIKKHKLVEVGYVSIAGKAPKLKAAGRTLLASRRESAAADREQAARLAELPDTIEGMTSEYLETVRRLHVAVMGGNIDAYAAARARLELLEVKANGGSDFGMAADDSPAELLRQAALAPLGEVPAWGEAGIFQIEINGTPYLIAADQGAGFGVHAVDSDRPFGSESGFRSFVSGGIEWGDEIPPPIGRDEFCRARVEEWLAGAEEHDRKKQGKPIRLYRPAHWYVMPATWAEATEQDGPPLSIGCLIFERGVLAAIAAKAKIPHHADTLDHLRHMSSIDAAGKITKHGRARIKQLEAEIAERKAAAPAAEPVPAVDQVVPYVEVRFGTHETLWTAFNTISQDAGAGSGYAAYPVPATGDFDRLVADLVEIETALAALSPAELATLAIGEPDAQAAIAARSAELAKAAGLLGTFARGWWKDDGAPPADDQLEIPAFLRRTAADAKPEAA